MTVKATSYGTKDLAKYTKSVDRHVNAQLRKIVTDTMDAVYKTARDKVPVDSGALRKSITRKKVTPLQGYIFVSEIYADVVENGTWSTEAQPFMAPAILRGDNLMGMLILGLKFTPKT